MKRFILILFLSLSFTETAFSQNEVPLSLGDEYDAHGKERYSGKSNNNSVRKAKSNERGFLVTALLFVPNRVLDILDIVRFDVGVGPSVGAVVRVTPHAQAGARFMMPLSLRLGLRGRRSPVFVEHTNEMGVGPFFLSSEDRRPSPFEVGAGVDLILAGVYLGISIDSVVDALAGFVGLDPSNDDL